MLGFLESSAAVIAIVGGIPVAMLVVISLGLWRGAPVIAIALAWLLAAGAVATGLYVVLRPTSQAAASFVMVGDTPLSPLAQAGGPSNPPPPASSPSPPPPTPASPTPTAVSACVPSGPPLQETAKGVAYLSSCLAAPADQAFTIVFDNQDAGTPHNIHIYSADPEQVSGAQSIFMGDVISGPATANYQVDALPSGTYFFHCDVHPTIMKGTLAVGG